MRILVDLTTLGVYGRKNAIDVDTPEKLGAAAGVVLKVHP